MKPLLHRPALLLFVALLSVGCASTEFQAWEGRNSVVEGRGGTKTVVDGMDVWTFGDTHNEALSVAAMRVSNPDRLPVGIHG